MFTFIIPKGTSINEFFSNHVLCIEVDENIPNNAIVLNDTIGIVKIEPIITNGESITPEEEEEDGRISKKIRN